ncbi:hypothetical protein Tco_0242133 [Tanacetum coccineum]
MVRDSRALGRESSLRFGKIECLPHMLASMILCESGSRLQRISSEQCAHGIYSGGVLGSLYMIMLCMVLVVNISWSSVDRWNGALGSV